MDVPYSNRDSIRPGAAKALLLVESHAASDRGIRPEEVKSRRPVAYLLSGLVSGYLHEKRARPSALKRFFQKRSATRSLNPRGLLYKAGGTHTIHFGSVKELCDFVRQTHPNIGIPFELEAYS